MDKGIVEWSTTESIFVGICVRIVFGAMGQSVMLVRTPGKYLAADRPMKDALSLTLDSSSMPLSSTAAGIDH